MQEHDFNRVKFYSKEDMAGGYEMSKGENILRNDVQPSYTDINDILELYNIKKYIDNELYLIKWTQEDIESFKTKVAEYGKIIGQFMSNVNDDNIIDFYDKLMFDYIDSFWEIINNHNVYKQISKSNFKKILTEEPHVINEIITHKSIVDYYSLTIKDFLLTYSKSAEILLTIYEIQEEFPRKQKFLPKSLSVEDKETIISNYLDSNDTNLNYIGIIQNIRNRNDFKISDKTRLKAKRIEKSETKSLLTEKGSIKYGVNISFPRNIEKIKDGFIDENHISNYLYSFDFIKRNNNPYFLFQNFKYLFEYIDNQNRIELVSKKSQLGLFERVMGVHSQNEYRIGTAFSLSEMASQAQIYGYNQIVNEMNYSLEEILHFIFTSVFQEKYNFARNASFYIPKSTTYFEKVRLLAPEFESILKQFKLFVEDSDIDFELLQISSLPSSIKDIPSLNTNKYIYFNESNEVMVRCSYLFFSDQSHLAYVEPFKDKKYHTFFELLANENVKFGNYKEYQKSQLSYLIENSLLEIDNNDFIQLRNTPRVLILKDLHDNEVGSYYHYPIEFQKEVERMATEDIISSESSLFSKPEQSYFNYFLNKSEFTNGLDLRNRYLHGTQANPNELEKHEYAYFTYMKLLVLTMLKIEDDLLISNEIKKTK